MFTKSITKILFAAAILGLTTTGCAPSLSPNTYNPYCAGQPCQAVKGVVYSSRMVKVEGTSTVGTIAGAALGLVAGSAIGGGNAAILGAVGGGLVGAGVGNVAERHFTERYAIEYVIKNKDGGMFSVVQAPCPMNFQRGQHVLVLFGPQARVLPDPDYAG